VRLVETAVDHFGPIDLFCSNAGISVPGGLDVSDQDWDRIIDINFKAHLYAARAVVPAMIERGEGYLLQTVSAAGLLTQIGSAPYSVTKHAALAFAEWLAINYGEQGLKVSCLCPQGVLTKLLLGETGDRETFLTPGAITVEQTADSVIDGLADERFLILPHPEVAEYVKRKAADRDRWIRGMRRLQARATGS
jgi:NAD(P)-dependent dehydrogenase (short-subunit alcohol dehydrogenase family)